MGVASEHGSDQCGPAIAQGLFRGTVTEAVFPGDGLNDIGSRSSGAFDLTARFDGFDASQIADQLLGELAELVGSFLRHEVVLGDGLQAVNRMQIPAQIRAETGRNGAKWSVFHKHKRLAKRR